MRCLVILLAAALFAGAGNSAYAVKRKPHHARSAAAHAHTRSHRNARARHASLEAKEEPPSATIPEVPVKHARMVLLPPLKGSRESLVRQNQRSEAEGLERIEDDDQLNDLRNEHALVAVPVSMSLRVNTELPANRRYCRPWTAHFLTDLGRAHYERFHRPLQVNSAVRTVAYQRHLMEVNGNAAPAEGDIASPHLTGATIDIAKKGLSMSEVAWMRAYLLPMQTAGKIDVEEEFYQSCFHITVYKGYAPPTQPKTTPREAGSKSALIAAGVQ
ncbi:hypothetical protein H7849_22845 [Alloacidobacterium dinghuense]|uniref:Peptidase M15 n=1 Tax=Alloacidobacterium dinghuense TaxID=2763107 RepID=A0A7G8BH19_9BACT|nr:DUF5715 family protein [Alloacidobacterium dinghuense]QNI31839.1 hypothetical protein H7849_22845 [Alloacidobacterium dinghuense]